jgi:hypothetical protein
MRIQIPQGFIDQFAQGTQGMIRRYKILHCARDEQGWLADISSAHQTLFPIN